MIELLTLLFSSKKINKVVIKYNHKGIDFKTLLTCLY